MAICCLSWRRLSLWTPMIEYHWIIHDKDDDELIITETVVTDETICRPAATIYRSRRSSNYSIKLVCIWSNNVTSVHGNLSALNFNLLPSRTRGSAVPSHGYLSHRSAESHFEMASDACDSKLISSHLIHRLMMSPIDRSIGGRESICICSIIITALCYTRGIAK